METKYDELFAIVLLKIKQNRDIQTVSSQTITLFLVFKAKLL